MKKKILITIGLLLSAAALGCATASASTITQNTYYSDNIYFPDGQYEMNFDFKLGMPSSTTNDLNKVIYNDIIPRNFADGTDIYGGDNYTFKRDNYQESRDIFDNINFISYYSNVEWDLFKGIEYNVAIDDSDPINNDLYFFISDFFYKPSDYQGHSLTWKNATIYYNAWLEEDFDINNDIGFIDYTIFKNENGVIVPYRFTDGLSSCSFLMSAYNNGFISIDGAIISFINNRHSDFYGFYINDLVIKCKDLYYYLSQSLLFDTEYYHYDNDMFTRLGNFNFNTEDVDISDFLVDSVGGFMDFEIVPGFSFGVLLSFILTLGLLVWIIKVFMGG